MQEKGCISKEQMSDRKKTNKQTHTQTLLNSRITILKYLFSIILMILGRRSAGSNKMLFCGLLELLVIWMLTEVIRSFRVRAVVNGILMLLLNAQMLILWFGGDYISLVMLTNLDNELKMNLFNDPTVQISPRDQIVWKEAGCLLSIAPVLLLYVCLQKHFTEGIERSGLVG